MDPARFTRALTRTHQMTRRVEVWSGSTLLTESAPIRSGSVTDEWKTGVRRTLTLSVPPSPRWLSWLAGPLTIRPYRGIRFSPSLTVECPMGVFDRLPAEQSRPAEQISMSIRDRWERVGFADFIGLAGSETGPVVAQLARLIRDANLPDPLVRTASQVVAPGQMFDGTRQSAVADLASAIAAECFIDRSGLPVIAQSPALGDHVVRIQALSSIAVSVDWSQVYNAVEARSTATNVDFAPQSAYLTWTGHPAHPNQTGWIKTYKLASAAIRTQDQAIDAAKAMLPKVSAIAGTVQYRGVPDPRLDSSDCVQGPTPSGASIVTQIKSVVTPLTSDEPQVVQAIMTRML